MSKNCITFKYNEVECKVSVKVIFKDTTINSDKNGSAIKHVPDFISCLITGGVLPRESDNTWVEQQIPAVENG